MSDRSDYYNSVVPVSDRVRLADLKSSDKSYMPLETQGKLIKIMQEDPTGGYALLGPSGWSKTTFLCALFREAVCRHEDWMFHDSHTRYRKPELGWGGYTPVVMIDASRLMDQIERYKYHDGPVPIVTVGKIERMAYDGIHFTVILDEFEKIKKSETRMGWSYEIINACNKARHLCQFIMSGNLKKADLKDTNQFLEGTFRRVEELTTTKEGKTHFWEFGDKQ